MWLSRKGCYSHYNNALDINEVCMHQCLKHNRKDYIENILFLIEGIYRF